MSSEETVCHEGFMEHCFRKCGSTISLPSKGGTASGGEYVFADCTPVLNLHKSERLHIQRYLPVGTSCRWWGTSRTSMQQKLTVDFK